MSASLEALVQRLEAAVAKLEGLGQGSVATPAVKAAIPAAPAAAGGASPYQAFLDGPFKNLVEASKFTSELDETMSVIVPAFRVLGDLINATTQCKKPTDQEIIAFLAPVAAASKAMGAIAHRAFKLNSINHIKAFQEIVAVLTFPFSPSVKEHVESARDAADMFLNKVLVRAKDLPDAEKEAERNFVKVFRATVKDYIDLVVANYKKGLTWNASGSDFASYKPGAAAGPAAPAGPPPPPPAGPPAPVPEVATKPAAPAGGMAALFSAINKGEGVTSGLRKVKDEEKTKNRKNEPALEPVESKAPTPAAKPVAAAATAAAKKPPSQTRKSGALYIENYSHDNSLNFNDLTIRDAIYIGNTNNSTIFINSKVKTVSLDKCFRVNIVVHDILSQIDLVNCDRVTVYVKGQVPTVQIDKSKGIIVNLNEEAMKNVPQLITSNISDCNVQIPGPSAEEDLVEIAIPEQFVVELQGKKLTCEPVKHG